MIFLGTYVAITFMFWFLAITYSKTSETKQEEQAYFRASFLAPVWPVFLGMAIWEEIR